MLTSVIKHLFQIQGLKVEEEVLVYMLIVHLTLKSDKIRSDLTIMHEKNFESLFIEIESNNSTMICGVIYRTPSENSKIMHYFLSTSLIFSNQLKTNPASYSMISIIIYSTVMIHT